MLTGVNVELSGYTLLVLCLRQAVLFWLHTNSKFSGEVSLLHSMIAANLTVAEIESVSDSRNVTFSVEFCLSIPISELTADRAYAMTVVVFSQVLR